MSKLISHVGLISQSERVNVAQTALIAAALQKQVTRDFSPIWEIPATVDSFARIEDVPVGYWPMLIKDNLDVPGAAGVHLDRNGQPYALVMASGEVALTCSHELLEMLVDPFGNRFVAGDSIKRGQGRVKYLAEVCDPSEAPEFGYTVNGLRVSDFYTPHYFDSVQSVGVRYSFTGAITKPRQVLRGGYLSWMDPATGFWWQANVFRSSLEITGPNQWKRREGQSWREVVDSHTEEPDRKLRRKAAPSTKRTASQNFASAASGRASAGWAKSLMEDVQILLQA